MPPRARTKSPDEPTPAARHAKTDAPICGDCWPDGWPTESAANASCVHGTWTR